MTTKTVQPDDPEKLFLEQLDTIDRAIRFACHRGSLRDADAEDFGSFVKLKLIENDYRVIRKHDRRSSFCGFISVVVQRLLLDYRITQWGKWHASAEAKRLGERGIAIEAMLHRDGGSLDEIFPALRRRWPDVTRAEVDEIMERLPPRTPRPRTVAVDLAADRVGDDPETVHEAAFESRRVRLAARLSSVVHPAIGEFEERDRLLLRLHFDGGMSIAEVARTLRVDQKPLYRRLHRMLMHLRARLESAGIGADEISELLATRGRDVDFDLGGGTVVPRPSSTDEEGI